MYIYSVRITKTVKRMIRYNQKNILLLGLLFLGILTGSCIREEALNTEADILGISFENNILANSYININPSYSEVQEAYPILIRVKEGTDLTQLAPTFELTPGATISPASGSKQDFTLPVRYTVTSEDGAWHRNYLITVTEQRVSKIPTVFHFENVRKIQQIYHEFYEVQDGEELTWASGNEGFKFAMSSAGTDDYPTVQYEQGKSGKCLKLETRRTGPFGEMVNMPIAAGNLFIGSFNLLDAISEPLEATKFGTAFYNKPLRLTGYYKYKAGEKFYENGEYTSRQDIFNIYAIFYEVTEEVNTLDGNLPHNNYEHPNMVALALISDPHETEGDGWEYFDIPFDYDRYGKTIDENKLLQGGYNIGIIFASSRDGDTFEGAPGSTLLIDEVELEYE